MSVGREPVDACLKEMWPNDFCEKRSNSAVQFISTRRFQFTVLHFIFMLEMIETDNKRLSILAFQIAGVNDSLSKCLDIKL